MAVDDLTTAEIVNTASLNDFVVDENLKALAPGIGEDDKRGMIETIKKKGLLEPISVLPEKTNGKWRIVDGFQRFTVIKENKLLKKIPFRIRSELKGKTNEELADWIKVNAGNRRHLTKYQKAAWFYEEAIALGWFEEAQKRMKAGKKDPDPLAKTARGYRSTLERIEKTRGVSRRPLSIYHRLKKIEESVKGINPEVHRALMELDLSLDHELIGYDLAEKVLKWWEDWEKSDKPSRPIINKWEKLLDGMKDKPKEEKSSKERKDSPRLFKVIGHGAADLDLLIVMVEQAKERGEIELDEPYVPEFRLRLPTDADRKKENVYIGEKIGGTIDEKGQEEKKLLESLRKTVDKLEKENKELKAKGVAERVKHPEQDPEMDKGIASLPSIEELKRLEERKRKPPKNKVSKEGKR